MKAVRQLSRTLPPSDPSTTLAPMARAADAAEADTPAGPLSRLDGRPLLRSLETQVLQALDNLWSKCSAEDRRVLAPIGSFLMAAGPALDEVRSRKVGHTNLPVDFRDSHPVASALLVFDGSRSFQGLERLLGIAVAAGLGAGSDEARRQVAKLCQNIRGALEDAGSPLRLILRNAYSLPAMVQAVDAETDPRHGRLHRGFSDAWRRWVRDRVFHWIHEDPEALRISLRLSVLVPDLDGAQVPLDTAQQLEPEDQVLTPLVLTDPEPAGRESPLRVGTAKAWARGLMRTSQGDLSVPPDHLAPPGLVQALVTTARSHAQEALSRSSPTEAEPAIALMLAIATGIRESDLALIEWGGAAEGRLAAIDPDRPVMHRAVVRPPNAVAPGAELAELLVPSVAEFSWPLPPGLHDLLKALHAGQGPRPGTGVLPLLTGAFRQRYRLWDVSRALAPALGLAASQIRLALASTLAGRFGPEVAQVLLADTFSLSAGPAYYTATAESAVAGAVAQLQSEWFGEAVPVAVSDRMFGSQLILTPAAARDWPARLRHRRRSLAHSLSDSLGLDQWLAHRDHLAAALLAVTGARPGDWLGAFDLDQVVPECGLVLISDKAADPLREVRVAATGRRWLADLRDFLDRLAAIAEGELGATAAVLASDILAARAPLFAVVTAAGRIARLDAATVRAGMPPALQAVPNHARHRLNQILQARGVSPELRHAQLGWVVTPAHTLADLSHWSARTFGDALSDTLDDILVDEGWYPQSQRTAPWSWRGVPDRPLSDWAALSRAAAARHEANVRRLREELRSRWSELMPEVMSRLAEAFAEYFPTLRLDLEARQLGFVPGLARAEPLPVSADHHALLCDRARQGDPNPGDATGAIATRILLYRLIRTARRHGVVSGPLPTRPFLSVTADPSPLLPGLGLAVRHAQALRQALLKRSAENRAHDQAPLTAWLVLANSATRQLDPALAAVDAAARAQAPSGRPDLIRVPAVVAGRACPMVFGGLPALALARRGMIAPTGRAPDEPAMGAWAGRALSLPFDLPEQPSERVEKLVALLQAAGRLELSGPERLVMHGDAPLAAVPVERSLARDDDWPVCNAAARDVSDPLPEVWYEPEVAGEEARPRGAAPLTATQGYAVLTAALDPERFARMRKGPGDGTRGWRSALARHLALLAEKVGPDTNVGLLVAYVRHRLRFGGRVRSRLAHATLGSDVMRFGSDLLAVAGDASMLAWDAGEFHASYLATLLCKPVTARRQAFDALMNFHEYLRLVHQAPEIPRAELSALVGGRITQVDPGMISPREVDQVFDALQSDLDAERALPDAAPEALRLLALRTLIYALLEASGIRPSSAYGLTLGDLFLQAPGQDFVRVRSGGEFGRTKSEAASGFFRLEGALWERVRAGAVQWMAQERMRLAGKDEWSLPVFARAAGERRRFSRAHLTRRIDELLKWSTGDRRAHTYWLRKNRVTAHHEAVLGTVDSARSASPPSAAAVYAALRASGHATMLTPMTHYLSDPRIVCERDVRDGMGASRAAILELTGLSPAPLDMAWQRAGGADKQGRLRVVLARLKVKAPSPPAGRITAPPPLRRGSMLVPRHLADYARARARGDGRHQAQLRAGLTDAQVDRLVQAAADLVPQKGVTPWPLPGLRQRSCVMSIPRALKGTHRLYALLDKAPPDPLVRLANSWFTQGHTWTFFEHSVIIALPTAQEQADARWLLDITGVELELGRARGVEVLRGPKSQPPSRSHAAGVRWVLALVWIFRKNSVSERLS